MEVEDEIKTEFTIDELTGSARERALDTLREWATEYGWWNYIRQDWAEFILPNNWAIEEVNHKEMWFDMDRAQSLALTDGRVNLQKLVQLKPEWFTNLALKYACEQGWIYGPYFRFNSRSEDTIGVVWPDYDQYPDLSGTPFDGMEPVEFWQVVDLAEFKDVLDKHVKDAARACLKAIEAEYDYLTNEEELVQMAKANDYLFDEEGNKV
jgi:hypothetical protein